jgi:outer membrane cobalamin receptor
VRVNYSRGPVGIYWDARIVGDRHDSSFIGLLTAAFESGEITVNPGYAVSGLGAEYRMQRRLTIYVRGDNIFDTEYEGSLGYPGMPPSAVIGLRFDLSR